MLLALEIIEIYTVHYFWKNAPDPSPSCPRFGDLNVYEVYKPDDDVRDLVEKSGLTSNNYTFLTIQNSEQSGSLKPSSTTASTQHFFCEFHGPIGKYVLLLELLTHFR